MSGDRANRSVSVCLIFRVTAIGPLISTASNHCLMEDKHLSSRKVIQQDLKIWIHSETFASIVCHGSCDGTLTLADNRLDISC